VCGLVDGLVGATHRPSLPEYLEKRWWSSLSVRRHGDVTSYLKTPRTYDAHVNGVSDYAESARERKRKLYAIAGQRENQNCSGQNFFGQSELRSSDP